MRITPHLLAILTAAVPLHAATRSSADYAISTDTTDSAGRHSGSADYSNDGSAGVLTGVSTAAPGEAVKHSFIGQLYEPVGLTIQAASPAVNETESVQLGARQMLDDNTMLVVSPSEVVWTQSPAMSVSSNGHASAAAVYSDTSVTIIGTHLGFTGVLGLTVLDFLPDNYGLYANDTLPDAWQVQYFGTENPSAGPAEDPDHDGQNNLFEYEANLNPMDPLSKLTIRILDSGGGGRSVAFSPRFDQCTYLLLGSSDLLDWKTVAGRINDDGTLRTIIDPQGTEPRRFYRVSVHRN